MRDEGTLCHPEPVEGLNLVHSVNPVKKIKYIITLSIIKNGEPDLC